MKLLEEFKSHSSKWVKTKGEKFKNFYWQNARLPPACRSGRDGQGYGAFSVNPDEIDVVKNYILTQKEHHTKKLFKMSTEIFWQNITLSMTNAMCGTKCY